MCDDDWDGGAERRGVMFCVAGADDDAYAVDDGALAAVSLTQHHTIASAIITPHLRI